MNNKNGIPSSLLTLGTAAAVIYALFKGLRSGIFDPFLKALQNSISGPDQAAPQIAQPMPNQDPKNQLANQLMNDVTQRENANPSPSN